MPVFNTEFAATRLGSGHVSGNEAEFFATVLKVGRRALGMPHCSDDLATAGYYVHRLMSEVFHEGRNLHDNACVIAGEVSDQISDHDAELLCQIDRISPAHPIGDMSAEVTAVHETLLEAAHRLADAWSEDE